MEGLAETIPADTARPLERSIVYGQRASLVGVLTYGANVAPDSQACVLILNSGVIRKVGPARLSVVTARRLAEAGFDVFRFDFAGVGDSPARSDGQSLGDGVVLDVQETMDYLEKTFGYRQFVVVGLCSGADNGMRAAEVDDRIVGLAMLDPTIDRTPRWYVHRVWSLVSSWPFVRSIITLQHPRLKALFSRGKDNAAAGEKPELYQVAYGDRASIAKCLRTLVARQTELYVAFTGSWSFIYNYDRQFYDVYPDIDFGDHLTLVRRPEADHCYLDSAHRQRLLDELADWCNRFSLD